MKYKKVELNLPELPPFGTVVDAWIGGREATIRGSLVGFGLSMLDGRPTYQVCVNGKYYWRDNIRPVPAWTPEKGELVACWNKGYGQVRLRAYFGDGRCLWESHDDAELFDFIARIPDGKRTFTEEELTPEWFKANSEVMEA